MESFTAPTTAQRIACALELASQEIKAAKRATVDCAVVDHLEEVEYQLYRLELALGLKEAGWGAVNSRNHCRLSKISYLGGNNTVRLYPSQATATQAKEKTMPTDDISRYYTAEYYQRHLDRTRAELAERYREPSIARDETLRWIAYYEGKIADLAGYLRSERK
jgi:hypothetical protein